MKTIVKRCMPPYFEQILNGTKRFEIRLNHLEGKDVLNWCNEHYNHPFTCEVCKWNEYAVGDTLELKEYIPGLHSQQYGQDYSGRAVACKITSIIHINIHLAEGDILTTMDIDDHLWWDIEDIAKYGLVVLGIEVIAK